ncbi:MAG TPA: methyltransferase domain-containing protein [Acidimicrobiales bacterium]|nr:methyltransferase domain-containing protein [Acidimicrobiales bacterium]
MCRAALALEGRTWRCGAGHAYDVAREGYVNLLVTHQRRAREPGDSAEMLRDRRAFLDAGWYRPLRDTVAAAVRDATGGAPVVVDAGCGEGYYTREWPAWGGEVWGVDIAKAGVRMAAKRGGPGAHYAVGSVYDLPVVDAAADAVVSVFAPVHSDEFERVLRPGGLLVTATPGPDHLDGLKRLLFDEPERHPERGPLDGAATRFAEDGLTRVRYEVTLDSPAAVGHLLGMVPYAWYVDSATRVAVSARPSLTTTVDFLVARYRLG